VTTVRNFKGIWHWIVSKPIYSNLPTPTTSQFLSKSVKTYETFRVSL